MMDTKANLLYKLGKIQDGIAWEEKAASLNSEDKSFQEVSIKMKKGLPTWPSF
jgi:hypothetical protein